MWAENLALTHLQNRGLQLIECNYREKFGELDIVMSDAHCLVFVEVRYRASSRWGDGLASITPAKQRRLVNAARGYLKRNPAFARSSCRFDVVSISGPRACPELRWVRSAFSTS